MHDLSQAHPIKLLFLRPPRYYWPIINESDNFLVPLGYPTLAGYIRKHFENIEIIIHDCCSENTGWKSIPALIERINPHILCIGEKVCYGHEADRAFTLCKEVNPEIITIAGGHYYSHLAEQTLRQTPAIDFVIRLEGEVPLLQLLTILSTNGDLDKVQNLAYLKEGQFIENPVGPNITDMSELPLPAYDLAHIENYAPFGLLWPRAVTVQRSRGCVDTCKFCSWIAVESKHTYNKEGELVRSPQFRSKSPEQMIEEIEVLYEKYGVRYLFWVDATWNVDEEWLNTFCDEIIRRQYKLGWWAFTRLDLVIRQHKSGTLKKIVDAGLRHILSGIERPQLDDLGVLGKHNYGYDTAKESLRIFREHYPEVFRQCTFITGLPDDNEARIKSLLACAHDVNVDFAAFHPLTPYPGTPLYDEALAKGWIEEHDFAKYDMFCPIVRTKYLTREEVSHWTSWCQENFVKKKPFRYASRLFSPHAIRRRLHWWFLFTIVRVMSFQVMQHVRGEQPFEGFAGVNRLWKPRWYDS